MYARIENNVVVEYPLNKATIKRRFSNKSFPTDFDNHLPEGYVKVYSGVKPNETEYVKVSEGTPELIDGKWTQTFVESNKYTEEELVAYEANKLKLKWQEFRHQRDFLLVKSDFVVARHKEQKELQVETMLTEGEYMAWLSYRQNLRNLPESVEDIDNVVWPTAPGILGVN
jgi:hypothetical protein